MKNFNSIPKFLASIILLVSFTTVSKSQVCKPSFIASGQNWGMYTSNVKLDSINNTSTMPANSPYYTYYNTQSTTVKTGYGYWVKVTSGPNTIGYGNIAAWLDFNGNDTFETNEKLGEIDDIPASSQDSIYFNVPNNADSGLTKMRVIFSYYYKNISACQNLYYGECEDYNINIQRIPCTSPPTAGTVISDKNKVCTNNSFILSLQGSSLGAGQTYQWQKSADNTNWTSIGSALNMTLKTSQSDSTYYRCLVTCGGYTDSTPGLLIAQKPATNCYCQSKSYYPTLANIANVTFGKFSNGSDTLPVIYNPDCKHGYTDFSNVGYIPLIRGNTYPFAVTQICGGYFYQCYIDAWIDYNQNGYFESSERIYTGNTSTGLYNNTIHKNITVPSTVKTGITGLRVRIAYFPNVGICDTAFYGESEDYNVYIYDQKKIDAYLYNIESPLVKSCYSNAEQVKFAIYNSGTDTIMFANNNLNVHLDMSNLNTANLDSVLKTGYLAPANSMAVSFKGTIDMSKYPGNYDINASIKLSGDSVSYNDKIYRTYSPDVAINTGYLQDFEIYTDVPKPYINDGFAWNYGTGFNASNSLRTTMQSTKKNSATSELVGPLTNLSAFKIYYRSSTTMPKTDTVYINISFDCGATFKTIYKILPNNCNANTFTSFQYNLRKYAGNNLIVKIITASHSTTSYYMDFDNFAVADKPQINLGNDTVVCDKITLYANPLHKSWDLVWSKYKGTADTIVVKSSGTYWCTASDSIYGISNTDSVNVTVYATPNVNLGPDRILCTGNTKTLIPGNFTNGYQYNWNTGDTTATITISKAGTYIVNVSAPAGCSDADTIIIATVNKPTGATIAKGTPFDGRYNSGTAANPDDACATNVLTYEVTPPTGYSNAQYGSNWFITPNIISVNGTKPVGKYNLTIPTSTTNGNISFMPDLADADSVYITTFTLLDANTTCDMSVSRYLKVNPAPVVNLGSDQEVCPGDIVYWSTGGNFSQYLWSNGNTSSMIAVSTPASYWLKVTDANGCSNSDTGEVLNFPLPTVNLGYDRGSCDGNAFILDAGNQSGYLWSTGANSQSIKVNKTGTYWAKVYSNDGCIAFDTVNVEILPKIKATFTYIKNTPTNILFTPDSGQYIKYNWNFGDSNSSTAKSPLHAYSNDGIYTVKLNVIAKYGCTDSATLTININTGINEAQALANDISVFPNPYNHEANLNFILAKNSQVNIEMYDIYGRKISTLANSQMAEGKHNILITTHNTAQAVYILRMLVDGQSTTIRLVDLGND